MKFLYTFFSKPQAKTALQCTTGLFAFGGLFSGSAALTDYNVKQGMQKNPELSYNEAYDLYWEATKDSRAASIILD